MLLVPLVILLGMTPTVNSEITCDSCARIYLGGHGAVYDCFKESRNGRMCAPDHLCYSMKIDYHKTEVDTELGIRDPPIGAYSWIFNGCVYKDRDIQKFLCKRKLKQFTKNVGTEGHTCEVASCDGDLCNREIEGNWDILSHHYQD